MTTKDTSLVELSVLLAGEDVPIVLHTSMQTLRQDVTNYSLSVSQSKPLVMLAGSCFKVDDILTLSATDTFGSIVNLVAFAQCTEPTYSYTVDEGTYVYPAGTVSPVLTTTTTNTSSSELDDLPEDFI